jgi:hypothetical protein
MTNNEVIERFEKGMPPEDEFHHADHLRVAFAYISNYQPLAALDKFCSALKRFAISRNKPQLYHETITWAYLFLIRERIAKAGSLLTWEEFARQNPDLLSWKPGVLTRYYREETLQSEMAKSMFVMPDVSAPV